MLLNFYVPGWYTQDSNPLSGVELFINNCNTPVVTNDDGEAFISDADAISEIKLRHFTFEEDRYYSIQEISGSFEAGTVTIFNQGGERIEL